MAAESSSQKSERFPEGFSLAEIPTPAGVQAQLERVLNSEEFVRSARIQRLLSYLVESVLAGQQERLKESVIGIEVFDRSPDYDPKADSIVRSEMRRTRSKLREYYATEGRFNTVLIWLDRGSYVPIFGVRASKVVTPVASASPASAGIPALTMKTIPSLPKPELNPPDSIQFQATDQPRWKRERMRFGLLAAALVVALTAAVWLYFRGSASPPARTLRLFPLTGNAGLEISPAFSPDSKLVEYSCGSSALLMNAVPSCRRETHLIS